MIKLGENRRFGWLSINLLRKGDERQNGEEDHN
jgi:hypothetical protein